MFITDCEWELDNIGKKTCEVIIDDKETVNLELLQELDSKFEYQVIKVAPNNVCANIFLEEHGFHLIETQIDIELKSKDFNYSDALIKYLEPDLSFKDVTTEDDFEAILDKMTPDMFISDRIALDPLFGLDYSYRRYSNWMRTSFERKSASFFQMIYKNEHIGFSMYRIKDGVWHGDLGGIYPSSDHGLGLLTACGAFMYMKQRSMKNMKLVSCISSNNTPVISAFNHCHYNFKRFKYVFVKHIMPL